MADTITELRAGILANVAVLDSKLIECIGMLDPAYRNAAGIWDVYTVTSALHDSSTHKFSESNDAASEPSTSAASSDGYIACLTLDNRATLDFGGVNQGSKQPSREAALRDFLNKTQGVVKSVQAGQQNDRAVFSFKNFAPGAAEPSREVQVLLDILQRLLETMQAGGPLLPMPAHRTVAPADRSTDHIMCDEEAAEKTYWLRKIISQQGRKGAVQDKSKVNDGTGDGSATSSVADAARAAEDSVYEGELTPAKQGLGGKKHKHIYEDDDEDDEEATPIKQQSPEETKVKVEGR